MLQPNGTTTFYPPTRYPNGVTTAFPVDPMANLLVPDPTKLSFMWGDATGGDPLADIANSTPAAWTKTTIGTGTYAVTDIAGMFSAIALVTTAASNDQNSAQTKGRLAAADGAKRLQFATRLQVDTLTSVAWLVGLTATDTTPIGASGTPETGVTDGIFFCKDDATNVFRIVVRSGNATVASDIVSLGSQAAATNNSLAFDYNPTNKELSVFLDGIKKTTLVVTTFPANALVGQISVATRSAAAKTLSVDYMLASQERA